MPIGVLPLDKAALIFSETFSDEVLGVMTVGVSRCCRDVRFAAKSFAKIVIRASNMLFEGVSPLGFVGCQVTSSRVLARAIALGGLAGVGWARARAGQRKRQRDDGHGQLDEPKSQGEPQHYL